MFAVPTAQEVESATPATRDRAVDVIRILSLTVVVVGHLLLVVLYFDASCPEPRRCIRAAGALDDSVALQWVTWALQIMPLFFFAGGAASVGSWKPGAHWGGWLLARSQRLYRPTMWFIVVIIALVFVCQLFVPPDAMAIGVPQIFVLLWFLGVYTVCLAFVPVFSRITTGQQVAGTVAVLYALTSAVDWARFRWGSDWQIGAPNFVFVWLIPTVLGVGYRKGLISRPAGAVMFVVALGVDLTLCLAGPYAVPMLSTADQDHISNFTPPSLLLAGHSVCLCGLAVAVAPLLRALTAKPQVWRWVAIGNTGAMTLYLWHWVVLFAMDGALIALGLLPVSASSPGLWPNKFVQAPLFLLLVFVAFLALRPLETRPLPWWDDKVTAPGWRSPIVGALLICAGASTLALARLGPQVVGLWGAGALIGSLALARATARRPASCPASRTSPEPAAETS